MNELLFAGKTVLPLLLLMSVGFFCRRIGLLNDGLVKGINQLIFKVFLPVNLFMSVLKTPYDTKLEGKDFLLVFFGLIALFLILMVIVPLMEKDKKKVGVLIQGMGRANYAFFGIPLVAMLFPGQDTSLAALLVTVTVPVYNVMSVIALSAFGGGKVNIKKILLNILKNPLIISVVLGFAAWLLHLQFTIPEGQTTPDSPLYTFLNDMAKVSTPLALFTLGGAIDLKSAFSHKKQLLMGVMGKLIVAPLVFLSLAVLMGIRGVGLACVFISFGAPTAVSSYPMAQQMGGDGELAAEIVAMTSVFSIVTTFLFIFLLKTMAFI